MDKDKNIYITPELYQSKIKIIKNIKIEIIIFLNVSNIIL